MAKPVTEEEEKQGEFLRVRKIETGIVVDHIPRGNSLKVAKILGLDESNPATVSLLMNVPSASTGLKDIIRIEGRELNKREIDRIALVAPSATINVVKDYTVVEKYKVKLPEVFEGLVACPNPNCISNREGVPRLHIRERSPLKLQCGYCEKVYAEQDFKF